MYNDALDDTSTIINKINILDNPDLNSLLRNSNWEKLLFERFLNGQLIDAVISPNEIKIGDNKFEKFNNLFFKDVDELVEIRNKPDIKSMNLASMLAFDLKWQRDHPQTKD